jgi:hypothetical protein
MVASVAADAIVLAPVPELIGLVPSRDFGDGPRNATWMLRPGLGTLPRSDFR